MGWNSMRPEHSYLQTVLFLAGISVSVGLMLSLGAYPVGYFLEFACSLGIATGAVLVVGLAERMVRRAPVPTLVFSVGVHFVVFSVFHFLGRTIERHQFLHLEEYSIRHRLSEATSQGFYFAIVISLLMALDLLIQCRYCDRHQDRGRRVGRLRDREQPLLIAFPRMADVEPLPQPETQIQPAAQLRNCAENSDHGPKGADPADIERDFGYFPRIAGVISSLSLVQGRVVFMVGFFALFGGSALTAIRKCEARGMFSPVDTIFESCVLCWVILWVVDCMSRPRKKIIWAALAFLIACIQAMPPNVIVRE
jgi:hypothetical protein